MSLQQDLALAHELADAADAHTLARFLAVDLDVRSKPDLTPVSDADTAVEQAIRTTLASRRPGDAVLGEEDGESGTGPRRWVVDPVDGTKSFVRGVPVWATLIALQEDGEVTVGVVSAPALGQRWWAAKGQGAWTSERVSDTERRERRIFVSGVSEVANASLSYNSLKGWDECGYLDHLVSLSREVWRTRAYGDMWSYMMVAEGLIDIAGEFDLKPWDMAALIPIVEEAGGTFTSAAGIPGPWHGSAIATNTLLHEAVLGLLK